MKNLEKLLKAYGIGLNYFKEDDPEADLIAIYRGELEKYKNLLSNSQLNDLKKYDLKALKLYKKYKNKNTKAVDWLKITVSIIKGNIPFRV